MVLKTLRKSGDFQAEYTPAGISNGYHQRMSVSLVAPPGFEPTTLLVRTIASPAARNFSYDMATETTIAVLRA
jgi:hypothetical protein